MPEESEMVEAMARRMLRPQPKVKLCPGDCKEVLADMEAESVNMVLTDPPHFLDGLDGDWTKGTRDRVGQERSAGFR